MLDLYADAFDTIMYVQERGEDIATLPEGKVKKYLDFIDILLEAKVSYLNFDL